jgi:hypothetical protein
LVIIVLECRTGPHTVFPLIAPGLHRSQDRTKKNTKAPDEQIMFNFLKRNRIWSSLTCLLIFILSIGVKAIASEFFFIKKTNEKKQ